jgi:hypothetical protein
MKTDILKLKVAVLAIVISCSAQAHLTDQIRSQQGITSSQCEEQFNIESKLLQIREVVKMNATLVESFRDRNNKESFNAFITRCQERLTYIEKNILAPLQAELARVKQRLPGSTYCKTVQLTLNLANEMAYKELQIFHNILDTHRKSDKAKNAVALTIALKPVLIKLTSAASPASLDLLDQKLTEIYNSSLLE